MSLMSGLPAEFLSTPFGQAMRPQIDAMFRRTAPSEHQVAGTNPMPPTTGPSANLLSSIAAQATDKSPETSPLTLVSSMSNLTSILKYPAVVVNFTNTPGCPPCRVIKPVYEAIAAEYASYEAKGARFVEVELGSGEGREIASRYLVHATPTFLFFRDGKKVDELKGASKKELAMKVQTFLDGCFPRHPHRKLYLPAIEAIPRNPITSATVPAYPALLSKLESFGAGGKVVVLRDRVVPFLEGEACDLPSLVTDWTAASNELVSTLKPESTFPLIDLWRVALLNPQFVSLLALALSPAFTPEPISPILGLASSTTSPSKPFLLTVLRLLTNILAPLPLANLLLSASPLQPEILSITVDSLLHPDTSVRSAAAGVALNIASWRHRLAKEQRKDPEDLEDKEWDVEIVSALVEAVGREADDDVAHRLLAALALMLYLSPSYASSVKPLLEVLGAKGTIEGKSRGYKKKEVKKLAEEIGKLC